MTFDRLLYTDCLPGQGRQGGGGFQVQARSVGVDTAQERAAVGALLYEAQESWIVGGRDVADFPPGIAHFAGEGFGTAQSIYLGKEATGSRFGNYLSDCLLTREPAAYGVIRPAQLWQAPHWREEPWDTTECPRMDGALDPGPLTADELANWTRADPRRPVLLARLLTVLEDGQRRVTVLAENPEDAVRWIAAATLLLPMAVALEVSFKVFSANAVRAQQRVLGVPKSLNPQIGVGSGRSTFVLDAVNAESDEAPVSDRARWWVDLLGTADPFDVVDAVELAAELAGQSPDCSAVRTTAWVLVADEGPVLDPQPLLAFLSGAAPDVLAGHGLAVAQRLLSAPLDGPQLRTAIAALGAQASPEVRQRLLAAELEEVRSGRRPPLDRLPAARVDALSRGDMESMVASTVLLGTDVEVVGVLQVAARHGICPPLGPVVPRLEQLVQRWVDDPTLPLDPGRSIWREELLALLQTEVRQRFTRGQPADTVPLLQRFGPHLAQDRPLIDDSFEVEVFAARASVLPQKRVVDQVHAAVSDVRSAKDAVRAGQVLQDALLRWNVVTGPLACWLVVALPPEVVPAPRLAAVAAAELHRRARRPGAQDLDAMHLLRQHYDLKSPSLDALAQDDRWLTARLNELRVAGAYTPALARQVSRLGDVNPAVLSARADRLLVTALNASTPGLGAAMLVELPGTQSRRLAQLWADEVGSRPTRQALSWGVSWAAEDTVPDDVRGLLHEALQGMLGRLPDPERLEWIEAVGAGLPAEAAKLWKDVHSPPASFKDRLRGRLSRG